jgi:RNA polymerase sigma-19 factor, ECF subfamily
MIHDKIITLENGNRIGYNKVFNDFYAPMRFHAQKLVKNEEEAKDITSHCFTTFIQIDKLFDDVDHIKRYLYRMVTNACIDYLKRRRIMNKYKVENNKEPIISRQFIERQYDYSDIIDRVYEKIQHFPKKQREVFILRHFEGKSCKEIALTLNVAEQTVKNQLSDVLKRLRVELGDKDFLIFLWLTAPYFINN